MTTIRGVLAKAIAELVSPVASRSMLAALPVEASAEVDALDLVTTQALVRQVETTRWTASQSAVAMHGRQRSATRHEADGGDHPR